MVYFVENLTKFNLFSIVDLRFNGNKQSYEYLLEKKAVPSKNYIYINIKHLINYIKYIL